MWRGGSDFWEAEMKKDFGDTTTCCYSHENMMAFECCVRHGDIKRRGEERKRQGRLPGRSLDTSVKLPFILAASLPARGVSDIIAPRTAVHCCLWGSNQVPYASASGA